MFDELNQPNITLRELFGVEQQEMIEAKERIVLEKQDLPFAEPMETIRWRNGAMPVFGAISRVRVAPAPRPFPPVGERESRQSAVEAPAAFCFSIRGICAYLKWHESLARCWI